MERHFAHDIFLGDSSEVWEVKKAARHCKTDCTMKNRILMLPLWPSLMKYGQELHNPSLVLFGFVIVFLKYILFHHTE